jgi:hypothetical protein
LKAASGITNGFPKAFNGHTNGFPKAAANSDKKLETNCIPSKFLKPVHFAINDFVNLCMTALAA